MIEIGPVQMIAVGFPAGAKFEGAIIDEIVRLEGERTIRVLDLLFVAKDTDSDELVVLDHQAESHGAIAGALLAIRSAKGWLDATVRETDEARGVRIEEEPADD